MSKSVKKNKSSNLAVTKWVFKNSKKYFPLVIVLSVIMVINALSAIYLALASKRVLDIATKSETGSILNAGIWLFVLVIIQIIFSALTQIFDAYTSEKLRIHFRNMFFTKLSQRKYSSVSEYHSGDLLNRLSSDVEVVSFAIVGIIPSIVSMLTKIVGGTAAIILLDKRIAVIILVCGLTVPAIGRVINKHFKQLHRRAQETEGKTRSFLQECFENLVVLKVFSGEGSFKKKLNVYMHDTYVTKMKRTGISVITHLSLYAFFTLGYYCILIWGAGSISGGVITYGTLTAFLQLFNQLRAPLQNVSGIMPKYYSMIASAERLIELESGEYDLPADRKRLCDVKSKFDTIEFSGVDFAYKEESILKNCSFTAKKGKITAITGESGSGKSTVLKLILGLYDIQSGNISINGDIPLDTSIRGLFTYVPQGNMILSGTIKENITLCNDTIPESEIEKVAKTACIYDFISDLPNGFDTILTERGGGLSEGQIQRISIARALLTDAPILLFDEATSALDEATETKLLENIKNLSDKTILFVTHRHTSLSVCDKIIHVENKNFVTVKE